MKFTIQSPHIQKLNQETQMAVQKKFERFEKHYDRIERCNIVIKKEKNAQRDNFLVEATLVVPGNDLFAKNLAASFEVAAEMVCQDLERQIKKHKDKLRKKTATTVDEYLQEEDIE